MNTIEISFAVAALGLLVYMVSCYYVHYYLLTLNADDRYLKSMPDSNHLNIDLHPSNPVSSQ